MPHLVKVQKKYEKKGLAIVAIHRQAGSLKGKVMGLAQEKGINYTVTQQGSLRGDDSRGIPRAWLFDWTGKCVWEGHPAEMDSAVDSTMAKAPHWLTRGRQLKSKKVLPYVYKLQANSGFGTIANALGKLAEKGEGQDKEEATFLRDNILKYGNDRLARASTDEKEDALEAAKSYRELSGLFRGTEIGDKAGKRQQELKTDKAFQDELKAARYLAAIQNLAAKLKPGGTTKKPNIPLIATMRSYARLLQKKYPNTTANSKAQAIVSGIK